MQIYMYNALQVRWMADKCLGMAGLAAQHNEGADEARCSQL